jgi:ATP-dependent exoDNAse (exonuclease V) beta subunit
VGDPKQAIYRFRGADIEAYKLARDLVAKQPSGAVLKVTANFRSRSAIVDHVNKAFERVLSGPDQPDYVAITSTFDGPDHGLPAAAKITINLERGASAEEQREMEAAAVAEICKSLIGVLEVRREGDITTPLRAGDIALLAPTASDLWRYERALEKKKISIASQAGKALFRRQETQDLLALARTLADPSDSLAFGALMRGPLIGLSDEELLDVTLSLARGEDGSRSFFTLRTDPQQVSNPVARQILEELISLRVLVPRMTPSQLLGLAVERLQLRVVMAARHGNRNARALANLDAIIERARPYGVSGLKAFVRDFQRSWERKSPASEGRVDSSEDSVELVTMHSAKGLEWPVVIPINSSTRFRPEDQFVYRRSDDSLHWMIGGIAPPDLALARATEAAHDAREKERLWYVACTRAKDLLIIPHLPGAPDLSWSRVMDLGQAYLPELDLSDIPARSGAASAIIMNDQTAERFAVEAQRAATVAPPLSWHRPSEHDSDRSANAADSFIVTEGRPEISIPSGAGSLRGAILHKLMEELLTDELAEDEAAAVLRAATLLEQIRPANIDATLPAPEELGATALRTMQLPDLATVRPFLVPELPIWSAQSGVYLAGRADALVVQEGRVSAVIDWKSDINPGAGRHGAYVEQLRDYLAATGSPRGAIVYMTTGQVLWISMQDT